MSATPHMMLGMCSFLPRRDKNVPRPSPAWNTHQHMKSRRSAREWSATVCLAKITHNLAPSHTYAAIHGHQGTRPHVADHAVVLDG